MKQKLPEWLKRGIIDTESTRFVRKILKENNLNTVCDSARCPNKGECYAKNTATFMILGLNCTRNCKFCSVNSALPQDVNPEEPELIAKSVKQLGLKYVVITSVTRDDLPDGGAEHFVDTINAIRKIDSSVKIEVLTPDFKGDKKSIDKVVEAKPDVFNHNLETVKRLYPVVRPQAIYERSLEFLAYIKQANPEITTKSGIMVGLGETFEELSELFEDLYQNKCDILTAGQYIQPTLQHYDVQKYLTPDEFSTIELIANQAGIKHAICSPLVRSSYNAEKVLNEIVSCK